MKKNRIKTARLHESTTRQQLNELMEAIALIIARRQMKLRWAPMGHRS